MASEQRTGEVFDLGYQRYDGPREGRSRARKAMYWNGIRTLLGIGRGPKAKIVPILLFVSALIPAMVMAIIISVLGPLDDNLPGAGDYYDIISLLLFIFGAIMAPELISPDRKDRVLDLYLVRPISTGDYVAARLLAFFTVVLALALSGQVLLQVAFILSASDPLDYLRDNWLDTPRFVAAGVLVAAYITVIPMAVAAFTTRRAYASAFVIGLFMVTWIVSNGLTAEDCHTRVSTVDGQVVTEHTCEPVTGDAAKWFSLISLRDPPLNMSDMIFDRVSDEPSGLASRELNDAIPIAAYIFLTVGPAGLMWWQYRRATL